MGPFGISSVSISCSVRRCYAALNLQIQGGHDADILVRLGRNVNLEAPSFDFSHH